MNEKVYLLPDAETIVKAMITIDNDGYKIEKFYPYIASKLANEEKVAQGINLGIMLYAMDVNDKNGLPGIVLNLFLMDTDAFVDAIVAVSKEID